MKGSGSSNPEGIVRQAIAGAIGVVALFSGFSALFSIPNYIPVVALEGTKLFLSALLLYLARLEHARRGPVLLFLSLIPAISVVETLQFFPFFFRPDALLAVLIVGHLTELLLLVGLATVWLRWSGVVPTLLAGVHLALIFERLRDEPPWLVGVPILIGLLFALMVHFIVRFRRERQTAELQLRQVETLNHDLSVATAELSRYRQRDMLAALAASVAHEINNPANYVSGSLMLLEEQVKNAFRGGPGPGAAAANDAGPGPEAMAGPSSGVPAELLELIQSARHGMETISEVTNRLRSMFRESQSPPEEINLRELARSVVTMLEEPGTTMEPSITLEIPRDLTVSGHPADLHILLSNLLQNGRAAAGKDGTITLRAREGREAVRIVVEDDGPGVPKELESKLFEPFVSGTEGGTGIGLSLCRTVVERRGGIIRMERPKGGPTRFIVSIPRNVE